MSLAQWRPEFVAEGVRFLFYDPWKVEKVATALVEGTQRGVSVFDAYPVELEITPKTGDEDLREIGAVSSLLVDLIRDVCGLSGRITVEEGPDGVRVRVEPGDAEPHSYPLSKGG